MGWQRGREEVRTKKRGRQIIAVVVVGELYGSSS